MRIRSAWVALFVTFAGCAGSSLTTSHREYGIDVRSNGKPFATVHPSASPRPYTWPLLAPGGVPVTRNHPMGKRDGEQQDHPHHQSFWLAHGNVNGFDFWHGKGHRERVEPIQVMTKDAKDGAVLVKCEYEWLVDDDTRVMCETRSMRFHEESDVRTVDVSVAFRATDGEVTFGDTKEGMFALRVHPALRVSGPVAAGTLQNSEGQQGKKVWGKRARWIDDQGVVDGKQIGVTMMDHPDNLRHPTWWHARTYGLLAANPFGVHDFEKKPKGTGDYVLKKGETLSLRYRVLLHGGGWDKARIEAAWQQWAAQKAK